MRRLRRLFLSLALGAGLALGTAMPAAGAVSLAPGEPLDRATAQALLAPALTAAAGAVQLLRVNVRQPALPLANPYQTPATLTVIDASLGGLDTFKAVVEIAVGTHAPLRLELAGSIERLIAVPVPTTRVDAGMRLDDITFETLALPLRRVRGAWVQSVDELATKEALRPLLAGQPIAADAVGEPRLVRRGEPVTLAFAAGGLVLETTGVARADGALGALIDVRNTRSGAVVAARVRGPGRVEVEIGR